MTGTEIRDGVVPIMAFIGAVYKSRETFYYHLNRYMEKVEKKNILLLPQKVYEYCE